MRGLLTLIIFSVWLQGTAQQIVFLGNLQDAGAPQFNCDKTCCLVERPNEFVASIGVYSGEEALLFDATPDFTHQASFLQKQSKTKLSGVFLTHAHMGHYTGLMHIGREASNESLLAIYAMPRMANFLENNGPWDQLVKLNNVKIKRLSGPENFKTVSVTPIQVPHRDEYSETVGYLIKGANKTAFYLPDIDKWNVWEQSIIEIIQSIDYAIIDGTFLAEGELERPMSEIPHPFISETIALLESLPKTEKNKVWFTHFNHTNPMRDKNHPTRLKLEKEGYHFAEFAKEISLN
jgi:pyrroloquinoline quinone biosynthesis protein B